MTDDTPRLAQSQGQGATDPSLTPKRFLDDILSACDASNWDADLNTGNYFKGLRDAYEAIQEIAIEYQASIYACSRTLEPSDASETERVEVTDGSYQSGDILTYERTETGLGKIISHTRAALAPGNAGAVAMDEAAVACKALALAEDVANGMRGAAGRINLFGALADAYGAVAASISNLSKQIEKGEQVHDRNGLPWSPAVPGNAGAVEAWQPMETAPKDGTEILAYWGPKVDGGDNCIDTTIWHEWKWTDPEDTDTEYAAPTHWMPLPAAPLPATQAEK
jgi:hypothetical protein